MTIVGKEEHLRPRRQIGQHRQRCRGAVVVEVDEQIVGDEGQAAAGGEVKLDGGQP